MNEILHPTDDWGPGDVQLREEWLQSVGYANNREMLSMGTVNSTFQHEEL